jgi:hypothetical protein
LPTHPAILPLVVIRISARACLLSWPAVHPISLGRVQSKERAVTTHSRAAHKLDRLLCQEHASSATHGETSELKLRRCVIAQMLCHGLNPDRSQTLNGLPHICAAEATPKALHHRHIRQCPTPTPTYQGHVMRIVAKCPAFSTRMGSVQPRHQHIRGMNQSPQRAESLPHGSPLPDSPLLRTLGEARTHPAPSVMMPGRPPTLVPRLPAVHPRHLPSWPSSSWPFSST